MEHWSEKERWCLGNLTLGSKLPLDVIEICDRSKTISKTGTTKTKDIYVDISDTRFFKNRTDGNADFMTRLVSKGGVYSWYEGSKEDNAFTGRNVRFACLQIYCKSCYKFQICNDLPHLHACKLLICTRGKLGGKCGNGREAVRRKSVANPLQTNYFATSLHACKFNANTKFASDLHIRKSVDYIKLANGLQTCKLVASMKFAIGLHHVLYVRKLVANNKFASDLHIRKCVDYTNYTKPLV